MLRKWICEPAALNPQEMAGHTTTLRTEYYNDIMALVVHVPTVRAVITCRTSTIFTYTNRLNRIRPFDIFYELSNLQDIPTSSLFLSDNLSATL